MILNLLCIAFAQNEAQNDPDLQQHVLISYQWGAKSLVFKLKERLRAAGYKVCTDVERTGTYTRVRNNNNELFIKSQLAVEFL